VNRPAAVLATAGLLLAVAACGIPPESTARGIQPPPGPYQLTTLNPPAPSPSGAVIEQLFFIKDGKLVPVERRVARQRTAQDQMTDLLAGATDAEQNSGVSSALPGANVIGGVHVTDQIATVDLGPGFGDSGRNDAVLAFGQVVCTLDSRADVNGVVFQQNGQPVGVPRATGLVSAGPLTTADYASLLTA
jgi:spore germination protein GerM